MSQPIRDAILGVVVGDALGVPVEFEERETLRKKPVRDMTGYGTYNHPPGTWSDDSSLTLCTADELAQGYNLQALATSFVRWLYENHWTPYNEVFDVGNTTEYGIRRLREGYGPDQSGKNDPGANGNGSLMRILPLLFYVKEISDPQERYEIIRQVSAITHAHERSTLSCFYYLEYARHLLEGSTPREAYEKTNQQFLVFARQQNLAPNEKAQFKRLTDGIIDQLPEDQIFSDTYVIYTLEASIWCILTTENYQEAVLKAVNLGKDTDTTAAVTGGLAGLIYGADEISSSWLHTIACLDDIEAVIRRMEQQY